jgi:hypothetical protein
MMSNTVRLIVTFRRTGDILSGACAREVESGRTNDDAKSKFDLIWSCRRFQAGSGDWADFKPTFDLNLDRSPPDGLTIAT